MRKQDKLFIVKYFLNILNGIFLVFGLLLLTFSLWISLNRNTLFTLLLSTDGQSLVSCVSIMVLASGFIIVFIGLLGYLGSLHGIKWLVVMYMGLLVLVLAMQAAVLVLLYRGKEMIPNLWKVQMDELISTYGNKNLNSEEHQWDILDNFQRMGCEEDIKMWYENNAWLLISINSGLLSVDVLQFIAAVWLFRIMKSSIVLPKN